MPKFNYGYLYSKDNQLYVHSKKSLIVFEKYKRTPKYLFALNSDMNAVYTNLLRRNFNPKTIKREEIFYSISYNKTKIRNLNLFFDNNMLIKIAKDMHHTVSPEFYYDILLNVQILFWKCFKINLWSTNILSLTALAYKLYNKFFKKKETNIMNYINFPKENEIYRKAYFGGRTEVFVHAFHKPQTCFCYDINSCYPYIMRNFPMPVGKPEKYLIEKEIGFTPSEANEMEKTFFGFAKITWTLDETIDVLPVLPVRLNNKLVFPKGTHTGVYFSEEINLAKSKGYIIKYKELFVFEKQVVFKEFIDYFYKFKTDSKFHSLLSKYIMNRLYGAYAINSYRPLTLHTVENCDYRPKDSEEVSLEHPNCIIKKQYIKGKERNVSISAAIASYARIFLYKLCDENQKNIVYCDTDSVFVTKELFSNINKFLGGYKNVYNKQIINFLFLSPKFYCLKFIDSTEELVVKGFSSSDLVWDFDSLKNKFLLAINNTNPVIYLFHKPSQKEIRFNIEFKRLIVQEATKISTKPMYFHNLS